MADRSHEGNKVDISQELLESVSEFHEAVMNDESIPKRFTMRRVELRLQPVPLSSEAVRELRKCFNASQKVFAMLIGVSASALQSWEQGAQTPPPWASRILTMMKSHPDPWKDLLEDAAKVDEETGQPC